MTALHTTGLALALGCALLTGCVTNNIHSAQPGTKYDDSANIPTNQGAWGRGDESIAQNVQAALRGNTAIRAGANIKVQVNNGEVLLTGSATSDEDRIRAIRTAERVLGVRKVKAYITTN